MNWGAACHDSRYVLARANTTCRPTRFPSSSTKCSYSVRLSHPLPSPPRPAHVPSGRPMFVSQVHPRLKPAAGTAAGTTANWCDSWGRKTGHWVGSGGASMGIQVDMNRYYTFNSGPLTLLGVGQPFMTMPQFHRVRTVLTLEHHPPCLMGNRSPGCKSFL